MTSRTAKTIGLAAAALTALTLAAGHALAQRSDTPQPLLQQGIGITDILRPAPGAALRPVPDVIVTLQCREVGNGDVATVVRLTNAPDKPVVPAGNGIAIYGSDGQYVATHTLAGPLAPGGYVDVQVVPWQAVYQGCSAQTSV